MALSYLFDPNKQFQDKNGVNNVGGYLYVFINDSDDHAPTYCNFTGTLNPERIVLDNNGRAVVIVDELKTYRIEVYDRSGNMLWSQYPVRPTNVIYGDYNVYNADIYGTPDEIDVDVEMSASGVKKFTIKLANAVKTVIGNIQDTISSIVETVSTKADKVQGATAGNLAALDANGNLADSGKKTADFKTKQTAVSVTGGSLKGVASMSQNANGEVTLTLNDIQDGTTAQKGVVQLSNAINSTSATEAATPKAVKDAYDELNSKIVARATFLSPAEWAVQSQLPGDPAKVYYVENGTGEDAYTVYVWKESTSEYVEVDESSIDLDGYWHDGPTTTGNGNVITDISLGNDGIPQVVKGITALTQHQSVTDNNPTLAWGATSTVGTVGSTNLQVTMPSNPASGKQDTVSTDTDSSDFGDNTTIATGFGSDKVHLNIASRLWTYIQEKISAVLGLTSSSYGGKASTAGTADSATNYTSGGGIENALNTLSTLSRTRIGTTAVDLNDFAVDERTNKLHIYEWWGVDKNNVANKPTDNPGILLNLAYSTINCYQLVISDGTAYERTKGITWSSWKTRYDASWITSGTFGTSFIADDAITAAKVKDNETLPVNVSGSAGSVSHADSADGITYKITGVESNSTGADQPKKLETAKFYKDNGNGSILILGNVNGTAGTADRGLLRLAAGNGHYSNLRFSRNLSDDYDTTIAGPTLAGGRVIPVVDSGGAGYTTTPVYVDSNGQVRPCTPSSMYVGWASNVNLSKTVNAVNGDSIQAGTGASVTIGNAGNAKKWDGYAISVGTVVSSAGTISIV